jgi:hypothetical protein
MMTTGVCASCDHSSAWHKPAGCSFPGCGCVIDGPGDPVPRSRQITRCSVCRRRPDKWGGNHAGYCSRVGRPADAPEVSR